MRRSILAVLLSLLLVSFQQQVVIHALEHVGARETASLASAAGGAGHCTACDLLATGTDALGSGPVVPQGAAASVGVAPAAFTSRATAAPVPYSSRGPPVPC